MRLETAIALAVGAFALGAFLSREFAFAQRPLTVSKPKTRAELVALVKTLDADLAKMNAHQKEIYSRYRSLATKGATLAAASKTVADLVEAGGSGHDQLLSATKQMQSTQISFNLQYLQLQSQMQNENRRYTALSNIMKTKHETVKNSISNIR